MSYWLDTSVIPERVLRVLSGDHKALWQAFAWDLTPQQWDYWYFRAKGREPLSADDRAYLERMYANAVRDKLGVKP